jgi:hypothetical protein
MHNTKLEDHLLTHIRHCLRYTFATALYQVKVKAMVRPMISQSICLGVKSTLELVIRYYFRSESWCLSVGRPL